MNSENEGARPKNADLPLEFWGEESAQELWIAPVPRAGQIVRRNRVPSVNVEISRSTTVNEDAGGQQCGEDHPR